MAHPQNKPLLKPIISTVSSTNVIPLAPNYRTAERLREARKAEIQRLINKIGKDDQPICDLAFLAYQESLEQ